MCAGVLPPTWIWTCCSLEVLIYGLQLLWFYKIVQLALNPQDAEKQD